MDFWHRRHTNARRGRRFSASHLASVRDVATHVLLPLFAGGLLYVFWRSDTLLLFDWATSLHLRPAVTALRSEAVAPLLPSFFYYSLPNALWAYALVSSMLLTWNNSAAKVRFVWCAVAV